jgi:hypothetical protein
MEITVFYELVEVSFVGFIDISIYVNIDQGHGDHYRASQHEAVKSFVYI